MILNIIQKSISYLLYLFRVTAGKASSGVIYLGTGTSFTITGVSGYANFTADNFIVGVTSISVTTYNGFWNDSEDNYFGNGSGSVSKSYNASTGTLACKFSGSVYVGRRGVSDTSHGTSLTGTCFAYLVIS
jgi:hypothetical protein